MTNLSYEFNEKIHAIILNPYLSTEGLNTNCDLLKKYNIRNVSTSLNYLSYIRDYLANQKIKINALISFPFSDLPTKFTIDVVKYTKDFGADGVEYVPKFFFLAQNDDEKFGKDIEGILEGGLPLTLIFNKNNLEKGIFIKALEISLELGIKNFQFGDGFGPTINHDEMNEILEIINKKKFDKNGWGNIAFKTSY